MSKINLIFDEGVVNPSVSFADSSLYTREPLAQSKSLGFSKMGDDAVHLLGCDTDRKFRYAYKDVSFSGFENSICPSCHRVVAAMRYDGPIHKLMIEGGKYYPDYLSFTGAGDRLFLLSAHAVEVLSTNRISGLGNKFTVSLVNAETDAPQYYCVEVTGSAELDFDAMHLKKKKHCAHCGQFEWNRRRMDPIMLDEASWDGSDLCRIKSMPGFLGCSADFVRVVTENKLTGFSFR